MKSLLSCSNNEYFITLRTLHHIRSKLLENNTQFTLRSSLTDVITYMEATAPKELINIINNMYNN